jgi:O-antigen/teichoic acid export membrane protein
MKRLTMRKSLTVSAISLMTATIATNALGLVFWAAATRLRTPEIVGRAAATVAALTLLASIAQLNLTNVFVRLVPTAGRLGRRLVGRGYLAVVGLSLLLGAAYAISGMGAHVIGSSWGARAGFVLGVVVLAIFALQDAVLVALRMAPWVTVENVSFATAKFVLLPAAVLLPLGAATIVVSWVVPAAVAVIVVSILLFTRVFRRLEAAEGQLPERRRMMSFVAGEYAAGLCGTATVQLIPLIVAWKLGNAQVAYFTLPWLISMGITVLLWNVAQSFVVEVAGGHGASHALLRRTLVLWSVVVAGALIVCVLGAPLVLAMAGGGYATHGAELLRLIGLAVPFNAIVAVYCTQMWLAQRVWPLAAMQAASGVAMLISTVVLLPRLGLVAVGWTNLGTQAIAAAMIGLIVLRRRMVYPRLAEAL